MMPIIPHLSSECLEDLQIKEKEEWPIAEKKFLIENEVEIVVQINGKKRSSIKCKKGINEEKLMKLIMEKEKIKKYFNDKKIVKNIFVKDRLINLIVK